MPCFTGHIYKQKDGKCQGAGHDSQPAQRDLLQAQAVDNAQRKAQNVTISNSTCKIRLCFFTVIALYCYYVVFFTLQPLEILSMVQDQTFLTKEVPTKRYWLKKWRKKELKGNPTEFVFKFQPLRAKVQVPLGHLRDAGMQQLLSITRFKTSF